MYEIEFVDTIAVRRIIHKGTSTTDKPVLPSEFMGEQNKEKTKELLNLA